MNVEHTIFLSDEYTKETRTSRITARCTRHRYPDEGISFGVITTTIYDGEDRIERRIFCRADDLETLIEDLQNADLVIEEIDESTER